ncbi:hypothetical protein M3584_10625 [Bacillus safensis]|nr:hypothetical protein [Bacillus safensis]
MRSEFNIREHRSADLTPNARVCLHAELFSNKEKSFFLLKAACYNVVQYEAKGSGAKDERDRT